MNKSIEFLNTLDDIMDEAQVMTGDKQTAVRHQVRAIWCGVLLAPGGGAGAQPSLSNVSLICRNQGPVRSKYVHGLSVRKMNCITHTTVDKDTCVQDEYV